MAIPRVFVSSTCYDLKYIRGNVKYFIKTLGFEPVLSEEGAVFFNPGQNTQDACLAEVPSCQIFVLIIGGRFGEKHRTQDVSVTNAEYRTAVKSKIPIFTLIEQAVHNEYYVYLKNKDSKIKYPSVDSTKIFAFIDEVRTSTVNNAIAPFKDFSDIESYLKQQWSAMMFYFLTEKNEEKRVRDTLSILTSMNERITMLSEQILKSVGTPHAKITAELYEEMMTFECVRDAGYFGCKPTPLSVFINFDKNFAGWIKTLGAKLEIEARENEISYGPTGMISQLKLEASESSFTKLKEKLQALLKKHEMTIKDYIKDKK